MTREQRQAQLDRIEAHVRHIDGRVSKLESKSAAWGGLAGLVVALITKLTGCV